MYFGSKTLATASKEKEHKRLHRNRQLSAIHNT